MSQGEVLQLLRGSGFEADRDGNSERPDGSQHESDTVSQNEKVPCLIGLGISDKDSRLFRR
jgi:hypothetical protein